MRASLGIIVALSFKNIHSPPPSTHVWEPIPEKKLKCQDLRLCLSVHIVCFGKEKGNSVNDPPVGMIELWRERIMVDGILQKAAPPGHTRAAEGRVSIRFSKINI